MSQITLPPWAPVRHDRAPWSRNWQCVLDADGRVILTAEEGGPRKGERATYHNAARVVRCVNACEGIDDPAAVLAEVRAALADHLRMLDEGPGCRTQYGHARTAALLDLLAPKS